MRPVPAVPYVKPKPVRPLPPPPPPVYVEKPKKVVEYVEEKVVHRPNGRGGHVIGHTIRLANLTFTLIGSLK